MATKDSNTNYMITAKSTAGGNIQYLSNIYKSSNIYKCPVIYTLVLKYIYQSCNICSPVILYLGELLWIIIIMHPNITITWNCQYYSESIIVQRNCTLYFFLLCIKHWALLHSFHHNYYIHMYTLCVCTHMHS